MKISFPVVGHLKLRPQLVTADLLDIQIELVLLLTAHLKPLALHFRLFFMISQNLSAI